MPVNPVGSAFFSSAILLCSCGVPGVGSEAEGVSVAPGPCGRGLLVVESDYQSSNASALSFDGRVLSESLVRSRTESAGFGVALSGDAVLPSTVQAGPRIALIDRFPSGVLRFVDLASARTTSELAVGTGFLANPQDYLEISEHKAYVARYERNSRPGQEAWDSGGDLLIVDPSVPVITGRIDLEPALASAAPQFSPHPGQLLSVDGRVFAVLAAYADDYRTATTSRLVEVDPVSDELVATVELTGLARCASLALSPDHTELAVACTGDALQSASPNLLGSGLAVIDITGAPRLRRRFEASAFGRDPLSFSLAYAAPGVLLFTTFGHLDDSGHVAAQDTLLRLDTASGQVDSLLSSESAPFSLGAVRCQPGCGLCFVADAERAGGSVLRFTVDGAGALGTPSAIQVERRIGLPPRYLSEF